MGCTTVQAAPPLPTAAVNPVAVDDLEIARRIDAYFAPLNESADISGTLRVERAGRPVVVRHFGFRDWPQKLPHQDDTLYSAASITKGITAAALIHLMREGRVSLDAPVGIWVPMLDAYPDMTLRAILLHRAGLPRDLPDDFDPAGQDVAAWLAAHPDQIGAAGKESYSNIGYALLAEVIAAASGQDFARMVERLVLAPAGMAESLIRLETADSVAGGALPYTAGPGPTGVMTPIPAALEVGSSGLVTTAADLAKWVRKLADNAYPELFMGDDPLGSIDEGRDGRGAYVSVQGTLPGYVANAIAWRDSDLTVSFVGNLFSYPALDLGKTLRALVGENPPPPPVRRSSQVPLGPAHRALEGDHRLPGFGAVNIVRDRAGQGMILTIPGRPAFWSFYLTPIADGALHWRAFDRILRADDKGQLSATERGKR